MKKERITYPTNIVNATNKQGQSNGGWHGKGKRAYRRAVKTIYRCLQTYKEPRLYHVCVQGGTNEVHKDVLHALVQKLDRAGASCEWFAAREVDSIKGEHLHVFLLIDSKTTHINRILNRIDGQFMVEECKKHGLALYINKPKSKSFRQQSRMFPGQYREPWYAQLPFLGDGNRATELGMTRLEDALIWLTYIYKARGKPDVEGQATAAQIFPASRPNRKRATSIDMPVTDSLAVQDEDFDDDGDAYMPAMLDGFMAHVASTMGVAGQQRALH